MDLLLEVGYRFLGGNTAWVVTPDGESPRAAQWSDTAPEFATGGLMVGMGMEFIHF